MIIPDFDGEWLEVKSLDEIPVQKQWQDCGDPDCSYCDIFRYADEDILPQFEMYYEDIDGTTTNRGFGADCIEDVLQQVKYFLAGAGYTQATLDRIQFV